MRFNGTGEAFSRSPELFCWWLPAAFPRLCLAPRQKYGCCRDHVGRGSANGSRGLPGRAANGGRGSAVDVRQLLRHAAVRQLLSRPRSDSAALHQAAAAPRPARSAPQVSCCLGPAPLLPPGPAAAQSPGHPLAVQSVARFQPRHYRSSPLSLARVSARVVSNPSPSDRFILTPGNAPPPPRHTRKTLLLGSAGCLPATAIFSLVPRLPYWPQTELLC